MEPLVTMVVTRRCTSDDLSLLRKFRCCPSDGPIAECALEAQRHIRGLKYKDFKSENQSIREILVTPAGTEILAFCESGMFLGYMRLRGLPEVLVAKPPVWERSFWILFWTI